VSTQYVIRFVLLLAGMVAAAGKSAPVVREEHKVVVDGVEENWRLEWTTSPKPACSPEDNYWSSCPCNGFAFGERGDLVLVRQQPGQEAERFPLGPIFGQLAGYDAPGEAGEAVLRRWDVYAKDVQEKIHGEVAADFAVRVRARPTATVMSFADYDHDGKAGEFLLQVGTVPCGVNMSVAIGISRRNPHLHVFSTVDHPERPLVLQAWQWESLMRAQGPVKVLDRVCYDHGSQGETELELRADAEGIHATRIEYECTEDGSRGKLVSTEAF
jgi:hypothetical protein